MEFPKSRILTIQQLISEIAESNRNGERFCFILGSGASVESGIPSGNTLEMQWMNCLMGESEDRGTLAKDPADVEKTAQALYEERKLTHSFADIKKAWEKARAEKRSISSEYYFDIYKLRFYPNQRNGYRYMERLMEACEPSFGYHSLALLLTKGNLNNLVITTNFDSLVEDALFLYTTKKPLVVSHESLAGFIESDIQRPIVAKVHRGLMYAPFNSPDTTNRLQDEWRDTLNYAFNTYTPIVIGYGGGDHSLMAFLEDEKTMLRHGVYWCYRKASGLPDKKILELLERKNGYLVEISGFDAMMLELGNAMFPNTVSPSATGQILQNQCDKRMQKYNEQWKKLRKNPDAQEIVQSINRKDEQAEERRERKNTLTAWDYRSRGWRAGELGDHQAAIEAFTKAIEMQGDFASDYFNRGYAYQELEAYGEAISDYTKAIELDPGNAAIHNNRGNTYAALGQYEEAIADYNKAIDLNSTDADIYCNRGSTYDDMDEYEKAIADYDKAIELDPADSTAYNNRGYTYSRMGRYRDAIADCNRAIELAPEDAYPYHSRGTAYYGLKDYQNALADFNEALRLNPQYKEAYQDRAKTYRAVGQEALAQADEEQAAKL